MEELLKKLRQGRPAQRPVAFQRQLRAKDTLPFQQQRRQIGQNVSNFMRQGITNIGNTRLENLPAPNLMAMSKARRQMGITEPYTPTIREQFKNTIATPITTAFDKNKSPFDRGIGALQGAFNSTPAGQAYQIGTGGVSGMLKSKRTGAPLTESIRKGISNPMADIAMEGLGIENPVLALGLNVLSGNPKGAIKGIGKFRQLKNASKFVKSGIHPDDIKDIYRLRSDFMYNRVSPTKFGDFEKQINRLFTRYADTAKVSKTLSLEKKIDALFDLAKYDNKNKTPFKMGFAAEPKKVRLKGMPTAQKIDAEINGNVSQEVGGEAEKQMMAKRIDDEIVRLYEEGKRRGVQWANKPLSSNKGRLKMQAVINVAAQKSREDLASVPTRMTTEQTKAVFDPTDKARLEKTDAFYDFKYSNPNVAQERITDINPFNKSAIQEPVLHGTPAKFDKFDISKAGQSDKGFAGKGIYFTNDEKMARYFADDWTSNAYPTKRKGNIISSYVDIKKPLVIEPSPKYNSYQELQRVLGAKSKDEIPQKLKEAGYDGIVIKDYTPDGKPVNEYVVFDEKQIQIKPQSDIIGNGSVTQNLGRTEVGRSETDISGKGVGSSPIAATLQSKSSLPQQTGKLQAIKNVLKDERGFINFGSEAGGKGKKVQIKAKPTKSSSEGIISDKYAFNLNKNNLQTNKSQKAQIDQVVAEIKPELEKIRGKTLTFNEVKNEAKKADLLQKVVGREQTSKYNASLLATRQKMVTLNNEIDRLVKTGDTKNAQRLTLELIENMRVVSSNAADAGRKLGSFRIMAADRPFREQIIDDMIRTQKMSDNQITLLSKEASKVDFNNPKQVAEFYRKFVKPTIFDNLEQLRYFNLLSSPLTHVVNTTSNAIQTMVTRPATKLVSGAIDPIASALTGKQRENYISEVPVYYRGMFASFPEAFNKLSKVFKGESEFTNLDFAKMNKGASLAKANIVTKSLEGMDQFFRTLVEGAEREAFTHKFARQGTKVAQGDIDQLAKQAGEYSVFRQGLNMEGQGKVLDWFDKGTNAIMGLRRVPGVGWFVPFIQTPMNILKQGFEYSPAGFSTMVGAANKREQLSKALVGSMVFSGAGYLAMQDRLTYAAPKDPEQKKNFYAAGMQPYSVKIGDKWVSYSKLGPLSYPLALAAAVKYAFKDNPNAVAQGTDEKILNSLLGSVEFFGDQSYLQGIGNIVNAFEGQEGYNVTKVLSSVPSQYIPAASFQRWVNNIIDPVYRKPSGIAENLKSSVIGMTGDMGYYENPIGEPSKRQYPIGNALNPFRTTKENPEYKQLYDIRQTKLEGNAMVRAQKKEAEKQVKVGLNPASASTGVSSNPLEQARLDAQFEVKKEQIKATGGSFSMGNKIAYRDTDGEVKTIDISPPTKGQGIGAFVNKDWNITKAREVWNANITEEEKSKAIKKLGLEPEDVRYDALANYEVDIKSQYLISKSPDKEKLLENILTGRLRSIGDNIFASDGVLDNLVDEGYLSKAEAKELKKIDYNKDGTRKTGSGGKKGKKITPPAFKEPSTTKITLGKPKLTKVQLGRSNKSQSKVRPQSIENFKKQLAEIEARVKNLK